MITSCASCEGRFGAQSERRRIHCVKIRVAKLSRAGGRKRKSARVRHEGCRVVEQPIVRLLAVLSNETFRPRVTLLELGFRKYPNLSQMLEDRRWSRDKRFFLATTCRVENLFALWSPQRGSC
jgi:hypothetical protein